MEEKKKLYPLKFIPAARIRPWGGNRLSGIPGKKMAICDGNGNEVQESGHVGECLEIADTGTADTVVSSGWLAGNSLSELMETYMERIVGEDIYSYYGRQFPLMVRFLDIDGRFPVQVNPDDRSAEQRYDSLGKSEMWYILDARPDAKIYMGFTREVTAVELYERCTDGSICEVMNAIHPRKGDVLHFRPGTVHAAEGGILAIGIGESSDLSFRLYDWGRDTDSSHNIQLEEAIDLIDYGPFRPEDYTGAAESGQDPVREIVRCDEYTVSVITVREPLKIGSSGSGRFLIYVCTGGAVSIQVPGADGTRTQDATLRKGETVLIPADMPDFFIVPEERDSVLLEAMVEKREYEDEYINPDTEPFLEGEDYGGIEDAESGEEDEDNGDEN